MAKSKKAAAQVTVGPVCDEHGNEEIPFDREAECGSPEDASCADCGRCSHEAAIWQMNDMACGYARICTEKKEEYYAERAYLSTAHCFQCDAASVGQDKMAVGVVAAPKQLALF